MLADPTLTSLNVTEVFLKFPKYFFQRRNLVTACITNSSHETITAMPHIRAM